MKLTKGEENKLTSQGILAILIFLGILTGTVVGMKKTVDKIEASIERKTETNLLTLDANRKEAKEIKFLRENKEGIEKMWSTLKGWGTGADQQTASALINAGLGNPVALPPFNTPGNAVEYAGIRLWSRKTEFQRLLDALTVTEANQGLVQVKTFRMNLPPTAIPNAERPTFLEIQLELIAPISK